MLSQASVQLHTTIRRSVCADLDSYVLVRSLVGVLNQLFPLLDSLRVCLARTQVSLMDQEHDVRIVSLLDDTLELISGDSGSSRSCVSQLRSSDHSLADLYIRQLNYLILDFRIESQIQLRFLHLRLVSESRLHRYVCTCCLRDYLVVTLYLFTLVGVRGTPSLATLVAQYRSYRNNGLLVKPLSGERCVDGYRHFATNRLKRLRLSLDVLFCQRFQLVRTRRKRHNDCQYKEWQEKLFVHNFDVSLKCYNVTIFTSFVYHSHYRAKLLIFFFM